MIKKDLIKVFATLLFSLAAIGCQQIDYYDQSAKEKEFSNNFSNNVLGGNPIDANQTWSTASKVLLTVKSEMDGKLYFFTENPLGHTTPALLVKTITAGTLDLAVAKPNDTNMLYAALVDADGTMRVSEVAANQTVTFAAPEQMPAEGRIYKAQRKGVTFPDAPDDSNFPSSVPVGVSAYQQISQWGYATGVSYLDESHTGNVNIWGGWDGSQISGGTLYIKGYNDYSTRSFYVAANTKIYLIEGATLILNSDASTNLQRGSKIYIAKNARLSTPGELRINGFYLYNRGTIEANSISGNEVGTLYNQGTVKVATELSVTNAETTIVNEGTITAGSYGSYGSGNFWNTGTMTVSGKTTVNSNCNVWINEGQYTTQDYAYTAGSINVWNLCKLTVTNLFSMCLGDHSANAFQMDAGSSVVTKNFAVTGPSRVIMAGNSIFKVTETATMNCTKADYGIYGPSTGDTWAVFQAKDIVKGTENQGYEITYGGNLYVACDSHFANGYSGTYPYIDFKGNAKICNGQETAPYVIPANGECSAGYNGGVTPPVPNTQYYYYAFEDLGTTDDFDFNDVVIRLSAPVEGVSNVEIVAAGGTLETYVTYGEELNEVPLGAEVHAAMGVNSVKTMVNTTNVDVDRFAILGSVQVAADADMTMLPFGLRIKGNSGETVRVTRSVAQNGRAPLVIVVNGNDEGKWFWATERTNITIAYEDFGAWGANVTKNPDWYKNPTGSVVTY